MWSWVYVLESHPVLTLVYDSLPGTQFASESHERHVKVCANRAKQMPNQAKRGAAARGRGRGRGR